jgi:hypothetical protein
MSPEQIRGAAVTTSSDLYSLSVLFYELVTGRVPFKGIHAAEIITKIMEDDPIPPKEIDTQVASSINEFILKGLEKKPGSRYLNAMEVEEKLEQILKSAGLGDSRVEMEQLFRQPKVYQERLRRLSVEVLAPSAAEKTTEPQKIDPPKALKSTQAEILPNQRGPEPIKVERPHYRVVQKPVQMTYGKLAPATGRKSNLIVIGIMMGLLLPLLWLISNKTLPWGGKGEVEIKVNKPLKESPLSKPNKTEPPIAKSPTTSDANNLPSDDTKQKSKPQTKQDAGPDSKETGISPKPPLREPPPTVKKPVKTKTKDGPRVKPLPSEGKPSENRPSEGKPTDSKSADPRPGELRPRPTPMSPPKETPSSIAQSLGKKTVPSQKSTDKGILTMSATGEGRLFLNGRDFGLISAQEKSFPLSPGGYEVKVIKEGFKPALGMAKIEGGRTTKLLSLKLEKEKPEARLFKLILTTSAPQVLIQIASIHTRESVTLSNSKKTLTLPGGSYVVKAAYKGKVIERTIILPSPYDTDGSITFNAEFE